MSNILTWWCNYMPLSNKEIDLLYKSKPSDIYNISEESYKQMEREYFSRMPFCNISEETHNITFEKDATTLIKKIFSKNVDDDTLVIYSAFEHPAAIEEIDKCKNKLNITDYADLCSFSVNFLYDKIKQYKKVFVYIIGTQISTGEITPQIVYKKLKDFFIDNNMQHKIVIDDVHGTFLVPRDYSLFDYIIYTAHALIRGYDMGILISKDKDIGIKAYNWGMDYLKTLDVILKRKDKLNLYKNIMTEYFASYLALPQYSLFNRTCNHIFSLKVSNTFFTEKMVEELKKYEIWLEDMKCNNYTFRFRGQQFIKEPELLINGINVLTDILNMTMEI